MLATTNKSETGAEESPAKSAREAELEYKRLLEEYERLRDDVDKRIRRMRGGRVLRWDELLARILGRKAHDTRSSK